jgi:hypothetical protein
LAAEKKSVEDLRGKLELTEANLQEQLNNRDSVNQIGTLAGERNLHIVDVYDADPNGKRHRCQLSLPRGQGLFQQDLEQQNAEEFIFQRITTPFPNLPEPIATPSPCCCR